MPLFPHLSFDPRETPLSFAARLGAFHRGGRVVPFLHDLRIPPADLARRQGDAVLALCDHAGVDPRQVMANTAISAGNHQPICRAEPVHPRQSSQGRKSLSPHSQAQSSSDVTSKSCHEIHCTDRHDDVAGVAPKPDVRQSLEDGSGERSSKDSGTDCNAQHDR